MRSLNRVVMIGHLAAEPEQKVSTSNVVVTNFPLATNYSFKTDAGEKREVVDFHRVVAFGRLAEVAQEYLAKGAAVYLEGRLINRSYEDKERNRRYRTEIIADRLDILSWRKGKDGKSGVEINPMIREKEESLDQVEEELVTV